MVKFTCKKLHVKIYYQKTKSPNFNVSAKFIIQCENIDLKATNTKSTVLKNSTYAAIDKGQWTSFQPFMPIFKVSF